MLYGELYNSPHGFFVRYTQEDAVQGETDAQSDASKPSFNNKRPVSKEAAGVQHRWINFKARASSLCICLLPVNVLMASALRVPLHLQVKLPESFCICSYTFCFLRNVHCEPWTWLYISI